MMSSAGSCSRLSNVPQEPSQDHVGERGPLGGWLLRDNRGAVQNGLAQPLEEGQDDFFHNGLGDGDVDFDGFILS